MRAALRIVGGLVLSAVVVVGPESVASGWARLAIVAALTLGYALVVVSGFTGAGQ